MFAAGLMMGGKPIYNIIISSSRARWSKNVDAPSIPASIPVVLNFTINPGIEIQSSDAGFPAVEFNGLADGSEVNLVNLGWVLGRGGDGGTGGSGNGFYSDGIAGQDGGTAVFARFAGQINITNSAGRIYAGGGGGGGGARYFVFDSGTFIITNYYGGGGGGGAGGGSGGAGGTGNLPNINNSGSAGIAGTPASVGAGGSGGAGAGLAGAGGAGGAYGAAGSAGTSTSFGSGGAGGGVGRAVLQLATTTVNFISGSSNPNVKGTVGT